jgi:hypothetical protein
MPSRSVPRVPPAPASHSPDPRSRRGSFRFYASNRRDGARLLSSALVIAGIGLVRIDHPIGRFLFLTAGAVSLYWWMLYRQLQH